MTQTMDAADYRNLIITEYPEHATVVEWIKRQYPEIHFLSNEAGHGRPNAAVHLQDGNSWPDLCILERRDRYLPDSFWGDEGFLALWLEIKTGPHKIWKVDGVTLLNKHAEAQWKMILWLRDQGHAADWGLGADDCIKKIESYLERGEVFYE